MKRTVAGCLVVACLAACAEEAPVRVAATTGHGVRVELPAGWQSAANPLTPRLSDPREVLAVGTFPLRYRETDCAHLPGSALTDLGPGDALVTLQERGLGAAAAGFPARPARFGPELGGPSEASACVPRARFLDHWFRFADGGRYFHVLVAFGAEAPPAVRDQAWAILDSLIVDSAVRPEWPSVG